MNPYLDQADWDDFDEDLDYISVFYMELEEDDLRAEFSFDEMMRFDQDYANRYYQWQWEQMEVA